MSVQCTMPLDWLDVRPSSGALNHSVHAGFRVAGWHEFTVRLARTLSVTCMHHKAIPCVSQRANPGGAAEMGHQDSWLH